MHLPIPCSSTVEIPNFLGLSAKFSSSCSLFLLSLIGFAVLGVAVTIKFIFLARKSKSRVSEGDVKVQKSEKMPLQVQQRTWKFFLSAWDGVNLPVTLTAPSTNAVVGRGIGINGAVLAKQMAQPIRSGPVFEQPCTHYYSSRCPLLTVFVLPSTSHLPVERTGIYGENDHVTACGYHSFSRMKSIS